VLLSGKADEEAIRHGANEAQIEGVFQLGQNEYFQFLKDFLTQKGLAEDEDTLLISCQLRRKGSGVIRVNGHAVTNRCCIKSAGCWWMSTDKASISLCWRVNPTWIFWMHTPHTNTLKK